MTMYFYLENNSPKSDCLLTFKTNTASKYLEI